MSFPGFTNQFTTSPISIAFPSYLGLSVGSTGTNDSPVQLYWPFQAPYEANQFSQVLQIIFNDSSSNAIILPDATATSSGQSCFIYNATATAINLYQYGTTTAVSGSPLLAGVSYELILTSNANQTGWKAIVFGESVATPASALIDTGTQDTFPSGVTLPTNGTSPPYLTYPLQGGLTIEDDQFSTTPGSYLKTYMHVNTYNNGSDDYQQTQGDRGTLLSWDTGGTLAYNLMPIVSTIPSDGDGADDGFIVSINNTNTTSGNCLITPDGTDTVEGIYTNSDPFVLLPGQSLSLISDGVGNWTTLGYGLNTVPTALDNVTVELQSGNAGNPSLSFYLDTNVSPANSLGLFYQTSNPGIGVVPGWAATSRGSLEFVQNNGTSPVILADFQANTTFLNGLVTLAWAGKSQISGSTFTPTLATLITNYTFSSSTATLWPGSTFTNTTASLFGSTFNATTATLFGSTFTAASVVIDPTGFIDLNTPGTITLESSAGNINISADTTLVMNVGTTANLNATGNIALSSSAADISLDAGSDVTLNADATITLTSVGTTTITAPTVNLVTPILQQEAISIYSVMRAYS